MSVAESQPTEPEPERHWLQFSLRTLLLLFVVLGSSLAVFGEAAIVVCPIALGLALFVNRVRSLSRNHLYAVAYCLIGLFGLWWLLPQIGAPREAGCRSACENRLQHIARALQNYHQANGCYPPAYIADKNGKPLHSWRTSCCPTWDMTLFTSVSTSRSLGTRRRTARFWRFAPGSSSASAIQAPAHRERCRRTTLP